MSARLSNRWTRRGWLALVVVAASVMLLASSCTSPISVATERNPVDGSTDDADLDAASAPGRFSDGASPPLDGGGDGKAEELSDPTDSSTD